VKIGGGEEKDELASFGLLTSSSSFSPRPIIIPALGG